MSEYDHLFKIPREKKNTEYKNYLEALLDYLYSYLDRIKPLLDIETELEHARVDFEKKWAEGTFQGWPVISFITTAFPNIQLTRINWILFRKKQLVHLPNRAPI